MLRKISCLVLTAFISLCCSSVVFAAVPVNDTNIITIDKAVEMAIANSDDLKKADLNIERSEEVREQAADKVRFTPLEPTTPAADMAFIGSIAAEVGLQITKTSRIINEDKVHYDTVKAYLDVLSALEDKKSASKEVEKAQLTWTIASLSYELGLSNASEKSMAQSAFMASKSSLEIAEANLAKAYRTLNSLIGIDLDERPVLVSTFEYTPIDIDSLETKITQVTSQNPVTKVMEKKAELSTIQLKLYNWADPTREPYKAKEIDVKNAELDVISSRQQIRDLMYTLHNSIEQLQDTYVIQAEQLKIAKEKYNQQKLKYDVGMISKLDYITAEVELEKAQAQLNKTLYQYQIVKFAFNKPWVTMSFM